jgi:hypothetical protein
VSTAIEIMHIALETVERRAILKPDRDGRFSEIFDGLNCKNLVRFIRAICHLKEIRNEVMHAVIDDENGGFCL